MNILKKQGLQNTMAMPSAFQKEIQNYFLILAMNLLQIESTCNYSVNL